MTDKTNKENENTNISPAVANVLKIAKAVDELKVSRVSKDLIFKAAIQVHFLKQFDLS